jgi:hypothetical protein
MRISAAKRREALRKRTKRGINERGQKGLGRKSVLDYSKAGNRKIVKYEIKSGKESNYIDILPFEITQKWYKKLRSVSGTAIGLEVGFTDYKLEIPVHKYLEKITISFYVIDWPSEKNALFARIYMQNGTKMKRIRMSQK